VGPHHHGQLVRQGLGTQRRRVLTPGLVVAPKRSAAAETKPHPAARVGAGHAARLGAVEPSDGPSGRAAELLLAPDVLADPLAVLVVVHAVPTREALVDHDAASARRAVGRRRSVDGAHRFAAAVRRRTLRGDPTRLGGGARFNPAPGPAPPPDGSASYLRPLLTPTPTPRHELTYRRATRATDDSWETGIPPLPIAFPRRLDSLTQSDLACRWAVPSPVAGHGQSPVIQPTATGFDSPAVVSLPQPCFPPIYSKSLALHHPVSKKSPVLHPFMSSPAVDYDALEAKTSIEEITVDELNQDTLRSLKKDELSDLWLCDPGMAEEHGDYVIGGSTELGWLGHFVKKSTRLESFGISGGDALHNCSEHSVDRFLDDLRKCNHIQRMNFSFTNLAEIIYKLGPAMINNNIAHLVVDECYLGVPGTIFLFNTLRDLISLEELYVNCEGEEENLANLNDGAMAGCIPSLVACTGLQKLQMNGLNLSNNSCASLSGVFPRMAALLELDLCGNLIDDDCVEVLVRGLAESKQIQSLDLSFNRIRDDGLDVLIQGLPASVDKLDLARNEVSLARKIPLLRFKELVLWGNSLSLGGLRVIAVSLANPECRLEELDLDQCNIGNDEAATLAPSLRDNQRLARLSLAENNITKEGWNAFSSILCDTSSINATYNSNHTLRSLGGYGVQVPHDIKTLLELNHDYDKSRVAANKILQVHRHLDMRPLFGRELDMLPYVVAWLERFAKSRPDLKLSSIYEFMRAMPMKVTNPMQLTDRGGRKMNGEKRKVYS
ncbi:hypothetical protein THAOC_32239, partial [Thalassiosira oceanica]